MVSEAPWPFLHTRGSDPIARSHRKCHGAAALFGAVISGPEDQAAAELPPVLTDKGYLYVSPIVGLRQHFDVDLLHWSLPVV